MMMDCGRQAVTVSVSMADADRHAAARPCRLAAATRLREGGREGLGREGLPDHIRAGAVA